MCQTLSLRGIACVCRQSCRTDARREKAVGAEPLSRNGIALASARFVCCWVFWGFFFLCAHPLYRLKHHTVTWEDARGPISPRAAGGRLSSTPLRTAILGFSASGFCECYSLGRLLSTTGVNASMYCLFIWDLFQLISLIDYSCICVPSRTHTWSREICALRIWFQQTITVKLCSNNTF